MPRLAKSKFDLALDAAHWPYNALPVELTRHYRRRDFPPDYHSVFGEDPDVIVCRGGSCIVDPFGNFLAGPNMEGEEILIAEIDRAQIVRGKYDLDVVGHYARPDIFQLHV